MNTIALPAVILGEGKSLISNPAQTGLLSHGRQPVLWKLHNQWYGWMMLFSHDGKSSSGGDTNNDIRNPKVLC